MWTPLAVAVAALCAILAGWAGVWALRDRTVVLRQLIGAAAIEVLLLAQLVIGLVLAGRDEAASDPTTYWGYLLSTPLVLPAAAAWAFAERTRWSSAVLALAALTVVFLEFRLLVVWAGG